MKRLIFTLLTFSALMANAQPKASIETIEILDKKSPLVLPAIIAKIDAKTTYASVYQHDSTALPSEIYVKMIRPEPNAKKADYLLEATTTYPTTGRFQIDEAAIAIPKSKKQYYVAKFNVKSSSHLTIKDKEGKALKTIVVFDNEDTKYTYCGVGYLYKLVPEYEFLLMLKSPAEYQLSGFSSPSDVRFLVSSKGSDNRTFVEKNLALIYGEIKNKAQSTMSEIAALLFAETSLNGFLQPGFKMHVLKKSSAKHYGQIDVKTGELKTLLTDWSIDIDNSAVQAKLEAIAMEFEQLGEAATDANIRILCYANAALGYTTAGKFDQAKMARKLAQESDPSWFGVVGKTTPTLYQYLYQRDAIQTVDTIDYRTLREESKM